MSASHSSSKTSDSTATTTNTSLTTINKNLSGNSGLVANADEGATLNLSYAPISISTDAGALEAGARVANAGISAAVTAVGTNAQLASDAIQRSLDANAHTEERAFSIVSATTQRADDLARDLSTGAVDFAQSVLTQFGTRLADYQQAEQTQLGNTVSALNDSYRDANKSSDQRIAEIAGESQDLVREVFKYGLIAAGVAVGAFLLSRGGKAFS